MGLEETVGAFEVGMDFDAQLVIMDHVEEGTELAEVSDESASSSTMGPVDIFGWECLEDKVAKWVYGGDDRSVAAVWVKGRLVHRTGIFAI